ncbi:M35 family metallo-endopeptidase [Derxia gummosa]|uniref:M35 family metallo-endopeptidase n=1 Tax=Derxia gummosa DSM 723 TaxID=1121388 RepID=A0A8B6X2I9_9BURK|nr:M35 family metallo-endopeptidase [Derxia gummosa]
MASNKLSDDYAEHRGTLQRETFAGIVSGGLGDLKRVLGEEGPDRNFAQLLEQLRSVALRFKEAERIMEAAGIPATGLPGDAALRKAASLKFLRHTYLVGARGAQTVWVVSTPKAYTRFPLDEIKGAAGDTARLRAVLDDVDEQFSAETKARFSEAIQLALNWAEAAKITLAGAASDANAMVKVKRWFAASDTGDADLNSTIAKVLAGFKKVATALNSNLITITDMPLYRNDASKNTVEAFIKLVSGSPERPRTIYIEKALFENYEVSVLHDMKKNWARVLLHEVTHSDAGTKDRGYAWKGIAPGTKITAADAAINADSWAFFAADCAGALADNEIQRALNGTGGSLTKLAKNWS